MTIEELDHYISNYILTKNPLRHDIDGVPFRIGQLVKVLENPSNDETFDLEFASKVGTIRFFEYESGCGQTFPNDPMICVELTDGKRDGFWKEELTLL